MRKQVIIFLLIAAVAVPSFASLTPIPRQPQKASADVQLERRIVHAVYEKFGVGAAASVSVEAKGGEVIITGNFSEMMRFQILNRVRRVEGVKSARWGFI
jgi:osmotically-inducible protein OsmY